MHAPHHHSGPELFPIVALMRLAAAIAAFPWAAWAGRASRGWSGWRTAAFLAGASLLGMAVWPPVAEWAHRDFRGHMAQHLLVGMFAPLLLVLAAPVTLFLRSLPAPAARRATALLRSRPARILAHPGTALILNIGGMYALYLTPLYAMTLHSPALHHLVHAHFLAAGYLFCWAILADRPRPGSCITEATWPSCCSRPPCSPCGTARPHRAATASSRASPRPPGLVRT